MTGQVTRFGPCAALLVILTAMLIGCRGIPAASRTSPSAATTLTPLAVASPPMNSGTPTMAPRLSPSEQTATCGTIGVRENNAIDQVAARAAEDCFWQAYQQCATAGNAGLSVRTMIREMNSDHFQVSTFTLAYTNDQCAIQAYFAEGNMVQNAAGTPLPAFGTHIETGTCGSLSQDTSGRLHLNGCSLSGHMDTFTVSLP